MNSILEILASSALAGYAGIVLVLVICGFGIPIPEDVILIYSGYLAAVGPIHWTGALVASFVGVILGDAGIYWVGQRYGPALAQHRFLARLFPREKIVHAEQFFAKHGVKAVFFARFVVGLRAAVFFTSGYLRVPFLKFVAADLLAAVLSLPVWIWLGWYFHERIDQVLAWGRSAEHALTALILLAAAFFFGRWLWRRRKKRAAEATAALAANEAPTVERPGAAEPPAPVGAFDPLSPAPEGLGGETGGEPNVNPDPERVGESSAQ